MRRIKAIYLIPVFLVLLIGAAAGAYYFLFKPLLVKVDAARKEWDGERQTCLQAESGYDQTFKDRQTYARQIVVDYVNFHLIQNEMPNVKNMKEMPGDEKKKLEDWYRIMGSGQLIAELTRWVNSFHQPRPPTISYTGVMGYEATLPSAKVVSVEFDRQELRKRGFGNLTNAIRRMTGHRYFPLIIDMGDPVTVRVIRNVSIDDPKKSYDPNNPLLTTSYTPKAFLLTGGWDPMGASAQDEIDRLIPIAGDPAQTPQPHRTAFEKECPPVLWFFRQQGLQW